LRQQPKPCLRRPKVVAMWWGSERLLMLLPTWLQAIAGGVNEELVV
jgi:hypothetical protein